MKRLLNVLLSGMYHCRLWVRFLSCDLASSHQVSAYEGLNFSCRKKAWRLAAWFSIPPAVHSGGDRPNIPSALCFINDVSGFSESTDPLVHSNTPGHLSKYWVSLSNGTFIAPGTYTLCTWMPLSAKTARILSAFFELHFSCIESAVGLHSETSLGCQG